MRIIYPSIIDYYKQGEVNAALTTLSGNLVSDFTSQDTTISGDIISYVDQQDSLLSEQIITASGDIISQIPIDYITTEELTTTSGDIVAQIGDISGSSVKISATQAGHGFSIQDVIRRSSGSYVKALANIAENAEACGIVESVDGDSFTFVENGIIEGLSGLTDGAVYFLSATSAGLMTTAEPDSNLYFSKPLMIATSSTTGLVIILRGLTVVSGTSSYATQDWVNTNFPDNTEMTTISGDIIAQIGAGEVTLEQLTTTSGDIVSQIPIDYISDSEMTTISGDIVAQIGESGVTQEQLTTTSGDIINQIPSLTGYATESWVGTNYIDNSEMTTISGDIVSQIGESGVTLQQLTTTSGDIIAQIPDDYISDAEMTTISGDIVAQIGESGITLQQLTTTSGDIVSQIPADYVTDVELTTTSGEIMNYIATVSGVGVTLSGTGGITASVSGGIWYIDGSTISGGGGDVTKAYVDQQDTTISGDIVAQIYVTSDWEPPDIRYKDTTNYWVEKGRYHKGGYKYRGHYQDLDHIPEYWSVANRFAVPINGTYASGVSSGILGGAVVNYSFYEMYMMSTDNVQLLPYVLVSSGTYADGVTKLSLGGHNTWRPSYYRAHCNIDGTVGLANYSVRVKLDSSMIVYSGDKIRLHLVANATTGNKFDRVSIVEAATVPTGTETPTEITFSGSAGAEVAKGQIVMSDWLNYTIDETKTYLITLDVSSGAQSERKTDDWIAPNYTYYKSDANCWDQKIFTAGYSTFTGIWFISKLEVISTSNGYITSSGSWNNYQLVKLSNDANDGKIYTIADTIDGTPDYVALNGDYTSEILIGDWFQLIPPSGTMYTQIGTVRWGTTGVYNILKTGKKYTSQAYNINAGGDYYLSKLSLAGGIPPNARIAHFELDGVSSKASCYGEQIALYNSIGQMIVAPAIAAGSMTLAFIYVYATYPLDEPSVVYYRYIESSAASWTNRPGNVDAQVIFRCVAWEV